MLRQIEWRLQHGPITKSGVLPVFLYGFLILQFSLFPFLKQNGYMHIIGKFND